MLLRYHPLLHAFVLQRLGNAVRFLDRTNFQCYVMRRVHLRLLNIDEPNYYFIKRLVVFGFCLSLPLERVVIQNLPEGSVKLTLSGLRHANH